MSVGVLLAFTVNCSSSVSRYRRSLRVLCPEPRAAANPSLQRNPASNRGVGRAADCGGLPIRSPWQNGFVERWIASLRKDCLNHVVAINESELRRVIRLYVAYYHQNRTHLGLEKDTPEERPIESHEMGKVVAIPRVGGLHHRYSREQARAA